MSLSKHTFWKRMIRPSRLYWVSYRYWYEREKAERLFVRGLTYRYYGQRQRKIQVWDNIPSQSRQKRVSQLSLILVLTWSCTSKSDRQTSLIDESRVLVFRFLVNSSRSFQLHFFTWLKREKNNRDRTVWQKRSKQAYESLFTLLLSSILS